MAKRSAKATRPPLSKEKIVETALAIIDAEGPEKLSMRRLGESLGVEAMAMYYHFPNKEAILDAVVARIFKETGPGLTLEENDDWKTVMLSGPAAAGRALAAHPNAGWLFLGREYGTAESLGMLETPLQILRSAGFSDRQLVDAAHAIFAYTAGWYLLSSGHGGSWSGPSEAAVSDAGDSAPLVSSLAPELRDWSRGMEEGLVALMKGLEAERDR